MDESDYIQEIAERLNAEMSDLHLPKAGADELLRAYALLVLAKGTSVTNEDVHDAWSTWATEFDPDNESLVPFDELPASVQNEDTPYTHAIRQVARSASQAS